MSRRRSLLKDKADWDQFRHHRDRHIGFCISNEFYQQVPFFYTREGCQVNIIGNYRGASAFMICNGPSVAKLNLSLLKKPGVITYGINNGPRTIRPNFWTCVDDPQRFLKSIWTDPCICKIVPHSFAEKKIFDNEKWETSETIVGQCPNVLYFHRNEKFMGERFLFEDTINWGNHGDYGGGRSVMLPVLRILFLLGFRKIYLVGADFKMTENYTYHFDEQRHKGAVNCNMSTYERLKTEYLPEIKKAFDEEGVEVFNCNPQSELKVFPFVDFEDAIAEATKPLGDVDHERTWGMYSKPAERQKWKVEPEDQEKAHLKVTGKAAPVYAPTAPSPSNQDEELEAEDPDGREDKGKIVDSPAIKVEQVPVSRPMPGIPPDGRVIRKIPCGPIVSRGSSTPSALPEAQQAESVRVSVEKNITLEDDGK